ncbi:myrosinase 1-like [Colias croceus]|uniref:myrosinase 1-like n=1 Tax=Colias crocea TaxID=72248 RepID=UPI001E27C674|nr:myrosinase 1-like [Colias croceus]
MAPSLYLFLFLLIFNSGNRVASKSKVRSFPEGFLFGASTSAYQVEGGAFDDGKGLSIWDVTSHEKTSPIQDGSTGDVSANSYHFYKQDVEIMKDLGLDFYKFSISWPRILPDGFANNVNKAGIDYYNNLIDEMLNNSIKPFVTMYHWDLPQQLQKIGGWTNPYIADWFKDYASVLFENFGDRVKHWITINGPSEICYGGYGSDLLAPMLNMTGIADYACAKNVLLAHANAYHLYDEMFREHQNGTIGIALNFTWFEPTSDNPDDHQAARDARQFLFGQYAHPIFTKEGDFPEEFKRKIAGKSAEQSFKRSRLPELSATEVTAIRGSADFLGINSYTTKMVYRDASIEGMYPVPSYMDDMGVVIVKDSMWPQSQTDWLQEVPWGFYKMLREVNRLYDNPLVYITENGWSTAGGLLDEDRIRYLRNYLSALLDAIDAGCNVQGYSVWSMIDAFEWRDGYNAKFGLYEVDFSNEDRSRTPRKSAFIYKEIIKSKSLDPHYEPEVYLEEVPENEEKKDDYVYNK